MPHCGHTLPATVPCCCCLIPSRRRPEHLTHGTLRITFGTTMRTRSGSTLPEVAAGAGLEGLAAVEDALTEIITSDPVTTRRQDRLLAYCDTVGIYYPQECGISPLLIDRLIPIVGEAGGPGLQLRDQFNTKMALAGEWPAHSALECSFALLTADLHSLCCGTFDAFKVTLVSRADESWLSGKLTAAGVEHVIAGKEATLRHWT